MDPWSEASAGDMYKRQPYKGQCDTRNEGGYSNGIKDRKRPDTKATFKSKIKIVKGLIFFELNKNIIQWQQGILQQGN